MHANKISRSSARLSLALSATALIFYFPANIFPFMTVEMYGRRNSSTIWSGVVSLIQHKSYFVGITVFMASILIPAIKLFILFYLSLTAQSTKHLAFKRKLHRFVESIGRWSMLDIFLLAILVALVKLNMLAEVHPEIGATLFLFVVIFTMLASSVLEGDHA